VSSRTRQEPAPPPPPESTPPAEPSLAQLAAASVPKPSNFDPNAPVREPRPADAEGKFPLSELLEGIELVEGYPLWQVAGAAASKEWANDHLVTREEVRDAIKEWLTKPVEPTSMEGGPVPAPASTPSPATTPPPSGT